MINGNWNSHDLELNFERRSRTHRQKGKHRFEGKVYPVTIVLTLPDKSSHNKQMLMHEIKFNIQCRIFLNSQINHSKSQAGVAEWFTAPCLLCAAWMAMGSSPKPPPMLADTTAGMWIKKARLPCWPLYSQQVSHQRWISGIHCMQVTKHASKGSTLALKPREDITRSPKQGYQWPHEKDLCPPKIY